MAVKASTEFTNIVCPVRHDQPNLGRFWQGLTQDWYFAIKNYGGVSFFSLGPPNRYAIS